MRFSFLQRIQRMRFSEGTRGYSENSALESAQEQPSHTVDQRKWTVTAAGLAAEFDNDNSLTDAWAIFPSRAALRHATWLVPCPLLIGECPAADRSWCGC